MSGLANTSGRGNGSDKLERIKPRRALAILGRLREQLAGTGVDVKDDDGIPVKEQQKPHPSGNLIFFPSACFLPELQHGLIDDP